MSTGFPALPRAPPMAAAAGPPRHRFPLLTVIAAAAAAIVGAAPGLAAASTAAPAIPGGTIVFPIAANAAWNTDKLIQSGPSPTVAGPLNTFSSPPHSAFADT